MTLFLKSRRYLSPVEQIMSMLTWGSVVLMIGVMMCALAVVCAKHMSRTLHVRLQQMQQKRDALHVEWTQLLLEQSALGSDVRVERVAREELGMVLPTPDRTVVIRP